MRKPQGVASLALGWVLHWAFSPRLLNPKLEYVIYCFYITKFKCSFVIISTCLPFWQRELSAKTLVTEVIKFITQCQHGNNPGYITYKVNVHFCLHPTLLFVIFWISAQKVCRQYLHAACTICSITSSALCTIVRNMLNISTKSV